MSKHKNIVFIHMNPFCVKLARNLRKRGYNVKCITLDELTSSQKKKFDDTFFLISREKRNNIISRNSSRIVNFFKLLFFIKNLDESIVIGLGSRNWFLREMFFLLGRKTYKRIYFPYDIAFFRYKDYKKKYWFFDRWSEKENYRNCDGIIHKGPEDELKYLPKEFKALEKPSLQFLTYCDEEVMVKMDDEYFDNKLSKKDGEIHLVYVGGVYHDSDGHQNKINIFKNMIKHELVIHIYPTNYKKIISIKKYRELEKTGFLRIHKPIYGKRFLEEISAYDWGFHIGGHDKSIMNELWPKFAFCNKISSYLDAGLPIIVSSNFEFISDLISESEVGLIIKNLDGLKERLHSHDYQKKIENVRKFRADFNLNHKISNLEEFLHR